MFAASKSVGVHHVAPWTTARWRPPPSRAPSRASGRRARTRRRARPRRRARARRAARRARGGRPRTVTVAIEPRGPVGREQEWCEELGRERRPELLVAGRPAGSRATVRSRASPRASSGVRASATGSNTEPSARSGATTWTRPARGAPRRWSCEIALHAGSEDGAVPGEEHRRARPTSSCRTASGRRGAPTPARSHPAAAACGASAASRTCRARAACGAPGAAMRRRGRRACGDVGRGVARGPVARGRG